MIRWFEELFRHIGEINGVAKAFESHTHAAAYTASSPEPARDFTDWDVAQATHSEPAHEPGRIDYKFLSITGLEDE